MLDKKYLEARLAALPHATERAQSPANLGKRTCGSLKLECMHSTPFSKRSTASQENTGDLLRCNIVGSVDNSGADLPEKNRIPGSESYDVGFGQSSP